MNMELQNSTNLGSLSQRIKNLDFRVWPIRRDKFRENTIRNTREIIQKSLRHQRRRGGQKRA